MKPERIRLRVKENAEITVRDRGGKFGVICIGPGWVEVEMRKKRRKSAKKREFEELLRQAQ
jgi:hypothetical protein